MRTVVARIFDCSIDGVIATEDTPFFDCLAGTGTGCSATSPTRPASNSSQPSRSRTESWRSPTDESADPANQAR
jgi:hypothetical protein